MLNKSIFPFFARKRKELQLAKDQFGLLVWDIFFTHRKDEIVKLCRESFVLVNFVDPGHTAELQVMDTSVNYLFKLRYKKEFRDWVAASIGKLLLFNGSADAQLKTGMKEIKVRLVFRHNMLGANS